jgi:diguanylate cyclase (GGDEF)-like protein
MFDVLTRINYRELQQLQLFESVSPETIGEVMESCVIRRLKRNEVLFVPDQPNHYLYQVMSGRLRVHLETLDSEPVSHVVAGELVGELSIIDNSLTSAFVVAEENCRLLVMEAAHVWALVEGSHAFARNLLQSLSHRLRHANKVIAAKMRNEDFYYHYGMVDLITGMHSRDWFDNMIGRALRRCIMQNKPFSVVLLDIDNFSTYNEAHGRLSGDMALNRIARTIKEHLRATELAVRYEGDRLLVMLPETDRKQARMVAERLRKKVMYTDLLAPDGRLLPSITLSAGISQATPGQSPEELMAVVMVALQRAKAMGRNYVSD